MGEAYGMEATRGRLETEDQWGGLGMEETYGMEATGQKGARRTSGKDQEWKRRMKGRKGGRKEREERAGKTRNGRHMKRWDGVEGSEKNEGERLGMEETHGREERGQEEEGRTSGKD